MIETLNAAAAALCERLHDEKERLSIEHHRVAGASVWDFGVVAAGSLDAGLWLATICMSDAAEVSLGMVADPSASGGSAVSVQVQSRHPLQACLASQYAGWPV
ncbi:MAG: methenyltetrahydromethanopterin cyclohydrolase, partial [Planctomycetota bacterium]